MVKMIHTKILGGALAAGIVLLAGCSDDFLQEKKNYGQLSPDIYNDYTGASYRLQDLYLRLLPSADGGLQYNSPPSGKSDVQSQATEEYATLSWYVDPDREDPNPDADWFHVNKQTSAGPWGAIRNCNDFIENVLAGTLSDLEKDELLGQAYFLRAWQYFLLVRTYGGVPIVDHVQATDVSQAEGLAIPRSTTKECIDWICTEMENAATMLPASWSGSDWGRVTKGAALAVAGRARLLYASPLFNRTDDEARWQLAYDTNKAAIAALTAGGFELENENKPGLNGSGFSQIFSNYNSKEAVFVTLYNKGRDNDAANEIWRNNHREQGLRPANAAGNATASGTNVTGMMLDLFPMADGKKPGQSETFAYGADELTFFKNRDPRFYRTFAFPGEYWRFDGDPTAWNWGDAGAPVLYAGPNYVLWNYAWHLNADEQKRDDATGFGADLLGELYRGLYVRKRSNDFDLSEGFNSTVLYTWPAYPGENRQGAFGEGAFPHMEIRYAEVLLNLAEAAVGIGETGEAFEILKRIRTRAGYDAAIAGADLGLVEGDRAAMFAAVLYERQIELAYEGKRFDDMRRWMLWDGGTGKVDGAPSTWTLTGFGGNTCTYLGVAPFNGQRRDNVELRTIAIGAKNDASDPLKTVRPAPLDLKKSFADQATVIDDLAKFYTANLVRKVRRGDEIDNGEKKYVEFLPKNYFIGLKDGAQQANQTLEQTIGWRDIMNDNANGTFDPLAEPAGE